MSRSSSFEFRHFLTRSLKVFPPSSVNADDVKSSVMTYFCARFTCADLLVVGMDLPYFSPTMPNCWYVSTSTNSSNWPDGSSIADCDASTGAFLATMNTAPPSVRYSRMKVGDRNMSTGALIS
ncbi:hypothetical protein PPTG_23566 [Phytophthora nicotianae INRA-310]|uniref:Uncharacterized protein n=1 Tax=Phytophthora nicotianae (strain INRA-310) TaxID=761204 RepID=W2PV69_PHYN3|nr:hypothetical protein PPTG_23566 [Phytophthora nicotianae INRA-310]ETN04531.1 hypothetical protein PPTG_23566 [Phytophthora nicotianae INRA-310]